MYRQYFQKFEEKLNSRARLYLDKVIEEEIRKDMRMRDWETNGNDPVLKQMSQERIRQEVERKLKDASDMTEYNKYII